MVRTLGRRFEREGDIEELETMHAMLLQLGFAG